MNHGRSLLHTVNHTIGCFDDPSYEGEAHQRQRMNNKSD